MTELPLKEDMTKAAIDYLEKQGYSIVEWVEFDSDDKTTWPKNKDWSSLVEYSNGSVEMAHNQDLLFDFYIGYFNPNQLTIKRIAEIPQPKDK